MGFIQHDDGILCQVWVNEALSQQHPICHVLDHSLRAGTVLKSDGVANLQGSETQEIAALNASTPAALVFSPFVCKK